MADSVAASNTHATTEVIRFVTTAVFTEINLLDFAGRMDSIKNAIFLRLRVNRNVGVQRSLGQRTSKGKCLIPGRKLSNILRVSILTNSECLRRRHYQRC